MNREPDLKGKEPVKVDRGGCAFGLVLLSCVAGATLTLLGHIFL